MLTTELEKHLDGCEVRELGQLTVREYGEALSLVYGERWKHQPDYRWLDMGSLTAEELNPARQLAQGIALAQSRGEHNKATNLLCQMGQLLYDVMKGAANIEIAELIYLIQQRREDEDETAPPQEYPTASEWLEVRG